MHVLTTTGIIFIFPFLGTWSQLLINRLKFRAVPSNETNSFIIFQLRALDVTNVEKGALGLGTLKHQYVFHKFYFYTRIQYICRAKVANYLNKFQDARIHLLKFRRNITIPLLVNPTGKVCPNRLEHIKNSNH